jgi:hypothetical protein
MGDVVYKLHKRFEHVCTICQQGPLKFKSLTISRLEVEGFNQLEDYKFFAALRETLLTFFKNRPPG